MDKSSAVIRVGDSTRFQATAFVCNGAELSTSWTWLSNDSSIVRVDSGSGWVRGVRSGRTDIRVTSGPPHGVAMLATITVVP
ncbi:MAG: Ig-like domain-containing protein [Gemmatimonadaceae bacterium]|nr:Ig-like domain-containing protein [Gemmatimonadaceae bacterium]